MMRKPARTAIVLLGAMTLCLLASGRAAADLVVNGGFETGNFSGWTTIPDGSGSLFGVDGNPHSGHFAAFFGDVTVGSYDTIQQTLATTPGVTYNLSYWLTNEGNPPNNFQALVGGNLVSNVLNATAFRYTNFTFNFTATSGSTLLQFRAYHVPSFFFLDDVSVNAVPEPSMALFALVGGLGMAGYLRRSRRRASAGSA